MACGCNNATPGVIAGPGVVVSLVAGNYRVSIDPAYVPAIPPIFVQSDDPGPLGINYLWVKLDPLDQSFIDFVVVTA